jgi:hypothetical protein
MVNVFLYPSLLVSIQICLVMLPSRPDRHKSFHFVLIAAFLVGACHAQTQDIVQQVCRQEEKLIGELGHLARECPTQETSALSSHEQTRLTRLVHGGIGSTTSSYTGVMREAQHLPGLFYDRPKVGMPPYCCSAVRSAAWRAAPMIPA